MSAAQMLQDSFKVETDEEGNADSSKLFSMKETWSYTAESSAYKVNSQGYIVEDGTTALKSGEFVPALDSDWESEFSDDGTSYNYKDYMSVNEKTHGVTSNSLSIPSLKVLRDIMAISIFRNYWDETSKYSESLTEDPWEIDVTDQTALWSSIISGSDYTISTSEDAPFEIDVKADSGDDQIEKVYADVQMDENLTLTVDLFCRNEDNSKGYEEWIVFDPSNIEIHYTKDPYSIETTDSTLSGNVYNYWYGYIYASINNPITTVNCTCNITYTVQWADGEISMSKPAE